MGLLAIVRARALVLLSISGDMIYERATKIKNKPRVKPLEAPQMNTSLLS